MEALEGTGRAGCRDAGGWVVRQPGSGELVAYSDHREVKERQC